MSVVAAGEATSRVVSRPRKCDTTTNRVTTNRAVRKRGSANSINPGIPQPLGKNFRASQRFICPTTDSRSLLESRMSDDSGIQRISLFVCRSFVRSSGMTTSDRNDIGLGFHVLGLGTVVNEMPRTNLLSTNEYKRATFTVRKVTTHGRPTADATDCALK